MFIGRQYFYHPFQTEEKEEVRKDFWVEVFPDDFVVELHKVELVLGIEFKGLVEMFGSLNIGDYWQA